MDPVLSILGQCLLVAVIVLGIVGYQLYWAYRQLR